MRTLLILATVLLGCLIASQALAHGRYNTADYDDDGNNTIRFYRSVKFEKHFKDGMDQLRGLHDRFPQHAPDWRNTPNRGQAEVIIQYAPIDNYFRVNYQCGNSAYILPGPDILNLDPECTSFKKPVMHEGGHLLGMAHHPCPDDQDITAMVPSCITLDHFGIHDRHYARQIPYGV